MLKNEYVGRSATPAHTFGRCTSAWQSLYSQPVPQEPRPANGFAGLLRFLGTVNFIRHSPAIGRADAGIERVRILERERCPSWCLGLTPAVVESGNTGKKRPFAPVAQLDRATDF
jgi:hypothetical protein